MNRRSLLQSLPALSLLNASLADANISGQTSAADMVYELREYSTYPGKLDDLLARFRDHTVELFKRHGMRSVAYWTILKAEQEPAADAPSFIYVLAHDSRTAAAASWKAFEADPDWQKVRNASEANGQLVSNIRSRFLSLADFSPAVKA